MREPDKTTEQLPEGLSEEGELPRPLFSPPCPACGRTSSEDREVWICFCGTMFRRGEGTPKQAELVTPALLRKERQERIDSSPSTDSIPLVPSSKLRAAKTSMAVLAVGALGVVFGDNG